MGEPVRWEPWIRGMTTSLFCWPHRDGFIAREKDSVASVGMTLRGHALKRRLLHKNFFKIKREKQERIAFLLFSLDFYGAVEYNKHRKRAIR